MTDVFIAEVRRSLRASLFTRLRPYGLSQDEVTRLVASATDNAMKTAAIPDLAVAASLSGPVADALRTAAPDSPALKTYDAARKGLPDGVRELAERAPEAT
ncbi:hypothetical protein [Brevundimonas sp.]|uniref:hypothetical protein n=1 Tax=Brevundimonas sp. TaxID=1871086 RepID=UPI00289F5A34|nr:hypothetical protein [Brevundimonas sp.]